MEVGSWGTKRQGAVIITLIPIPSLQYLWHSSRPSKSTNELFVVSHQKIDESKRGWKIITKKVGFLMLGLGMFNITPAQLKFLSMLH